MSSDDSHTSARPLTPLPIRAHPLVLGVALFLASELMFFAALFAAYYDLRVSSAVWPMPGTHVDEIEGAFGTLLLFLSSVFTVLASRSCDKSNRAGARAWLIAAAVSASFFVILSLHGYDDNTFGLTSSAYGSIYYTMTGFHLLHVTVGIGLLVAMAAGLRSKALMANKRAGFEAMSYYWHFVFIVWIGIYATIYWMR